MKRTKDEEIIELEARAERQKEVNLILQDQIDKGITGHISLALMPSQKEDDEGSMSFLHTFSLQYDHTWDYCKKYQGTELCSGCKGNIEEKKGVE